MRERLVALVDRILTLDAALVAAPGAPPAFRGAAPSRPGPPASEPTLAALEAAHGPLPPAYRSFLLLHDGWDGFPSHVGRARLFSCADFASAETAGFGARFRAARGHKTNRALQTALVIGGVEGEAYVLLAPAKGKTARRPDVVRTHGWSRSGPSQGDAADFAAFLERRAHLLAWWLEEASHAAPVKREPDVWACVDEAIALFNEPEENGEHADEADHALHALAARLDPSSPEAPRALVALLARERPRGTYVRARRAGVGVELLEARTQRWVRPAP